MLGENWARFMNCKSLWITVRNEQWLNSIFTIISSTATRTSTQIDYSFLFPKFPSVHAVRGIPGRWHLFFQFCNFPTNHKILFGRDNCRHIGWKCSAMNFCSVHHVWPKKLIPAYCSSLVHCKNGAAILERAFLAFYEIFPNADRISRRAKIEANTATNRSPKTTTGERNTNIVLTYWLVAYINTLHKPARVCI